MDGQLIDTAFGLRTDIGEEYLSVNWLEHFHADDRLAQLAGVRQALAGKGFRMARAARFAVLNVGKAIAIFIIYCPNVNLRIVVLGETHDPSHAGIYGVAPPNNIVAAALLTDAVAPDDVYPAII